MNASLWRHEIGRVGWVGWTAPLAAVIVTIAFAVLANASGTDRPYVAQLLLTGLEAFAPLAVGLVAVTAIARDVGRELHLSLPRPYLATLGRRVAVVAASGAAASVAFWLALLGTGWWTGPGPATATLVWLAPTLALTGLGLLVATLARSVVVATTTVAAVWLAQQIYAASMAGHAWARPFLLFLTSRAGTGDGWLTNRLVLSLAGLAMVAATAGLIRRRLLDEEER
ncbi:MAG: hypothetical protein IRY85_20715 [Micromonosporaceae bacterium]|nr:hypothetical protein [Micromonosporaceae bacterium]